LTESDLTRLATLYYVDGCTQDQLSKEFGISRATVGRLLRRAQEVGIVEIRVRPHSLVSADLERQLTERFHIKRALIAVDHKDADRQRELLAGLVAIELERIALSDDYFISRKLYPNVDFYTGLIYRAMKFPTDYFTVLFAIPRVAGWLSQWEELLMDKEQKIARPRQIYTGYDERPYAPVLDYSRKVGKF